MLIGDDYRKMAAAHSAARTPSAIFDAFRDLIGQRLGFGLLTMLMVTADGDEVQRIYTTDPANYPLSGRERLQSTPWEHHVFGEQRPYLGADREAIRWAFAGDLDRIVSLGLGATMNIPVVGLGETLGIVNIIGKEGQYTTQHLAAVASLAPFLAMPLLACRSDPSLLPT